jgi:hypothetical protein
VGCADFGAFVAAVLALLYVYTWLPDDGATVLPYCTHIILPIFTYQTLVCWLRLFGAVFFFPFSPAPPPPGLYVSWWAAGIISRSSPLFSSSCHWLDYGKGRRLAAWYVLLIVVVPFYFFLITAPHGGGDLIFYFLFYFGVFNFSLIGSRGLIWLTRRARNKRSCITRFAFRPTRFLLLAAFPP